MARAGGAAGRPRRSRSVLLAGARARGDRDLPACLAASPSERAADFRPPPAERADCLAESTFAEAWLPCRVAAALVPRSLDSSRVRLRSRVAAAFFAASCRSALVCAIGRSSVECPSTFMYPITRSAHARAREGQVPSAARCAPAAGAGRRHRRRACSSGAHRASRPRRGRPSPRGRAAFPARARRACARSTSSPSAPSPSRSRRRGRARTGAPGSCRSASAQSDQPVATTVARREDPGEQEAVRGRAAVSAADEVEEHGARPGADRDVGEERMERVPEPRAAEGVLRGALGDRAADGTADRLRGPVERVGRLDPGGQFVER